jgi:hypothetical protein
MQSARVEGRKRGRTGSDHEDDIGKTDNELSTDVVGLCGERGAQYDTYPYLFGVKRMLTRIPDEKPARSAPRVVAEVKSWWSRSTARSVTK